MNIPEMLVRAYEAGLTRDVMKLAELVDETKRHEAALRVVEFKRWTPERLAKLREMEGQPRRVIAQAVNALPGLPLTKTAVQVRMIKLGMRGDDRYAKQAQCLRKQHKDRRT